MLLCVLVSDADQILSKLLGHSGTLLSNNRFPVNRDQDSLGGLHDVHSTEIIIMD